MAATGTDGETAEGLRGQIWGQYNRKSTQDAAERGERSNDAARGRNQSRTDFNPFKNGMNSVLRSAQEQGGGPNVLALRDLARSESQAANRGGKGKRRGRQEVPVGVEPTNGGFANRCLSHLATAPQLPQIRESVRSGQEDLREPKGK